MCVCLCAVQALPYSLLIHPLYVNVFWWKRCQFIGKEESKMLVCVLANRKSQCVHRVQPHTHTAESDVYLRYKLEQQQEQQRTSFTKHDSPQQAPFIIIAGISIHSFRHSKDIQSVSFTAATIAIASRCVCCEPASDLRRCVFKQQFKLRAILETQ